MHRNGQDRRQIECGNDKRRAAAVRYNRALPSIFEAP